MKPPVPLAPAIVIAASVTALLVVVLAVLVPSPPQSPPSPAALQPAASSDPTSEPVEAPSPTPGLEFLDRPGETVIVTRIVDGDTFAVGRRTIKVLGVESCPMSTSGGRQAVEFAHNQLMAGHAVVLRRAPGVGKDSAGRELRVVEEQEHGFDYAQSIVAFKHTKAKEDAPGPAAYLETIDGADDGMDCSLPREEPTASTPAPTSPDEDQDTAIYVGDGGHDSGLRDGALTGGYCRKKWWC